MRSLDYVILYVEDLDRSIAFYRDVLGIAVKVRGDGYVELATGGAKFGLYERKRLPELIGQTEPPGGAAVEIVFVVDDLDAEADRVRGTGARILMPPTDRPWGHRTLHLADPDGHVVELAQEIPRSS